MRLFIVSTMLLVSFSAFASQQTGTVQCALYDQAGHSKAGSTKLVVSDDGTGGVGEASVELGGIKCAASGFSKFGIRSLNAISITVNGLKIESPVSQGKVDALLKVGQGNCVCFLK